MWDYCGQELAVLEVMAEVTLPTFFGREVGVENRPLGRPSYLRYGLCGQDTPGEPLLLFQWAN